MDIARTELGARDKHTPDFEDDSGSITSYLLSTAKVKDKVKIPLGIDRVLRNSGPAIPDLRPGIEYQHEVHTAAPSVHKAHALSHFL
jgi:hypothetical protein